MKASLQAKLDKLADRFEIAGPVVDQGDIEPEPFPGPVPRVREIDPVINATVNICRRRKTWSRSAMQDDTMPKCEMGAEEAREAQSVETLADELQKLMLPKDRAIAPMSLEVRTGA